MKKLCITILLIIVGIRLNYSENNFEKYLNNYLNSYTSLILAIMEQESGFNPKAINKSEKAYGILQIRKCVIDDVNNFYKTNYTHEDAFDIEKSIDIFIKYQSMWKNHYTNIDSVIKLWNGGPNWKYKNIKKYSDAVKLKFKKYEFQRISRKSSNYSYLPSNIENYLPIIGISWRKWRSV